MLTLATLIKNPGEPAVESRYNDCRELAALGYNGLVLYETTALSGVPSPDVVGSGELRRWVGHHFDSVSQSIEQAHGAGLAVYLFYDVLVLARDLVERQVTALTCRNRPTVLCPASERALDESAASLEAMLTRWPEVDGIVLRLGDTDAGRLPHVIGNDLYTPHCSRCSQYGRADRIVAAVERFHRLVVEQRHKPLIVRAWNVRPNGLHDSAELAARVFERLPGAGDGAEGNGDGRGAAEDPRFVLSFKFTQTDFWRYQRWNPSSLAAGRLPIVYELQCQREFEGKGGIPNWQVGLWRDGAPESVAAGDVRGLAEASKRVNLAGLWAWVRGGGWGGPFVKNEAWIDANVFAVPKLAQNPEAEPAALARQWIERRLNIHDEEVVACLMRVLEVSPELVRQAFYIGPYAEAKQDPWHPNADWISDDLLDAEAAWRMVQRLPESRLDEVIREKEQAVEGAARLRAELSHLVNDQNRGTLEPLVNTLVYAESLFEAIRDLMTGLVAYRRHQHARQPSTRELARQKLLASQSHWNHHTQRHGSLPGTATAFREHHFWELTQDMLQRVTE